MKHNDKHAADCKTCEHYRTCKGWRACLVYERVGAKWLCDEFRPISGKAGPKIDIET